MNLLQSLETYTADQKWVGNNFIILGAVLLILSAVFTFVVAKSPMAAGIKWGALAAGLLIIFGGFSYRSFCDKTQKEAETIYDKDKTEFVQLEHKRMEKVDKDFLTYQITFAVFVIVALIVILFINAPVLKGVAYSVAILFIGIMLIEGFSHTSIKKYTNELRQEVQK